MIDTVFRVKESLGVWVQPLQRLLTNQGPAAAWASFRGIPDAVQAAVAFVVRQMNVSMTSMAAARHNPPGDGKFEAK